jgi:predicted DNA-binding protein (MmcQ/YjbR family)
MAWSTSDDELRHPLAASYKLVRNGLPRKVQAQLDPFE